MIASLYHWGFDPTGVGRRAGVIKCLFIGGTARRRGRADLVERQLAPLRPPVPPLLGAAKPRLPADRTFHKAGGGDRRWRGSAHRVPDGTPSCRGRCRGGSCAPPIRAPADPAPG